MKKSLVLAMAMALGVTASAYAANPFSDVPAGHWAYDSISKLAAAGVVEGYPDGSFKGDNLMTRYEMAQIVAKAMAKGANVDALAAEFADELDNLGVRVAALEKKADNVKITGAVRYRYVTNHGNQKGHTNDLRTRLYLAGQVNDDWAYHGMMQNIHDIAHSYTSEENKLAWKEAYMTGKLGGLALTAGRYNAFFADGNVYDLRGDGVEASYGSKVKLTGFIGKGSEYYDAALSKHADVGTYFGGTVSYDVNEKLNLNAGYVETKEEIVKGTTYGTDKNVAFGQAKYTAGDVAISAMYLQGKKDKNGNKVNEGWR